MRGAALYGPRDMRFEERETRLCCFGDVCGHGQTDTTQKLNSLSNGVDQFHARHSACRTADEVGKTLDRPPANVTSYRDREVSWYPQ